MHAHDRLPLSGFGEPLPRCALAGEQSLDGVVIQLPMLKLQDRRAVDPPPERVERWNVGATQCIVAAERLSAAVPLLRDHHHWHFGVG